VKIIDALSINNVYLFISSCCIFFSDNSAANRGRFVAISSPGRYSTASLHLSSFFRCSEPPSRSRSGDPTGKSNRIESSAPARATKTSNRCLSKSGCGFHAHFIVPHLTPRAHSGSQKLSSPARDRDRDPRYKPLMRSHRVNRFIAHPYTICRHRHRQVGFPFLKPFSKQESPIARLRNSQIKSRC